VRGPGIFIRFYSVSFGFGKRTDREIVRLRSGPLNNEGATTQSGYQSAPHPDPLPGGEGTRYPNLSGYHSKNGGERRRDPTAKVILVTPAATNYEGPWHFYSVLFGFIRFHSVWSERTAKSFGCVRLGRRRRSDKDGRRKTRQSFERQSWPTKFGWHPPTHFVQNVHFCDFAEEFHRFLFRFVLALFQFCSLLFAFCSLLFTPPMATTTGELLKSDN
jgi:hypothetical protein